MEEMENTINVSVLILNNLRDNITRVTDHVLGEGYYNYEMDVYKSDEAMCNHLISAYDDLREKNKELKVIIASMWFVSFLLLCVLVKILMF